MNGEKDPKSDYTQYRQSNPSNEGEPTGDDPPKGPEELHFDESKFPKKD